MIQRVRQGVARAGRAAVCYGGGTLQFIQELKEELRADRTYAAAARCFLELIEDKKARCSSEQ